MAEGDGLLTTAWHSRRRGASSLSVMLNDDGLILGDGSRLARMAGGAARVLALDVDCERMMALLSVAYRRPIAPDVLIHIKAASAHWQRGDKALANLRLVFAGLPRLEDPTDVARLRLAEYCLDEGLPPNELMTELGLDPTRSGLAKYNRDELRDEEGRWTRGGDVASPRAGSRSDRAIVVASAKLPFHFKAPPKESAVAEDPEVSDENPPPEIANPLEISVRPPVGAGGLPIEIEPAPPLPVAPWTDSALSIEVPKSRFPEAADHISDAQSAGKPSTLTIDRPGARANRTKATRGVEAVPGKHRDEYPLAMFREGGTGASIRLINPGDNTASGAFIGNLCRRLPNGSRVTIKVVP